MAKDPLPDWLLPQRRHIGSRLRALRMGRHLSQERLAEKVGVSRKTISRWELAQAVPNLNDLLLLANALGAPLRRLLE